MPSLKSRDIFPPGGWFYVQPETGWSPDRWLSFNAFRDAIIAHRRANMRFAPKVNPELWLDMEAVAMEVEESTAAHCLSIKGGEAYVRQSAGEAPPPKSTARPGVVASAVAGVKRSSAGIKIVLDWLGEGMRPVAEGIAAGRAKLCSDCPQNQPASTVQKLYSKTMEGMALLSDFKATTPFDDRLNSCQACDCDLRFKVHTPMKHIDRFTTPEIRARLDSRCWILKGGA